METVLTVYTTSVAARYTAVGNLINGGGDIGSGVRRRHLDCRWYFRNVGTGPFATPLTNTAFTPAEGACDTQTEYTGDRAETALKFPAPQCVGLILSRRSSAKLFLTCVLGEPNFLEAICSRAVVERYQRRIHFGVIFNLRFRLAKFCAVGAAHTGPSQAQCVADFAFPFDGLGTVAFKV